MSSRLGRSIQNTGSSALLAAALLAAGVAPHIASERVAEVRARDEDKVQTWFEDKAQASWLKENGYETLVNKKWSDLTKDEKALAQDAFKENQRAKMTRTMLVD